MRNVARGMFWVILVVVVFVATWSARGQQTGAGIQVDKNSIGGTVLNTNGNKPEAGVWVIAETKSFQVPFRTNRTVRTLLLRSCERSAITHCGPMLSQVAG